MEMHAAAKALLLPERHTTTSRQLALPPDISKPRQRTTLPQLMRVEVMILYSMT